ncbi:hypothetical protein K439DRAFT_1625061 [Ramaria rubella]|nr:hypothetical protein K439DRAFT_1625061 [Ramaria rubella]
MFSTDAQPTPALPIPTTPLQLPTASTTPATTTVPDLHHMASHPTLLPPAPASPSRLIQQLSGLSPNPPRPGSRSPTSIPSSPTSIRSSSSAIFERDIEPLLSALPQASTHHPHHHHHLPNPHRTPRSKATEYIEQSVPSVLAEAATALADAPDTSNISVIAPASVATPLSFSPVRSRSGSPSPSPTRRIATLPGAGSGGGGGGGNASPPASPRSVHLHPVHRLSTGPLPPGAFPISTDTTPFVQSESPATATVPLPPSPLPSTSLPLLTAEPSTPPAPTTTPSTPPSPSPRPLPRHATNPSAASKRLSFISYSDLLASTPLTALPLSTLTSPPSALPPPHLPAVNAAATASVSSPVVSSAPSQGAPSRPLSTYSIGTSAGVGGFGGSLGLGMSGGGGRGGGLGEEQGGGVARRLQDDVGGEWEREGFGKGLEERLEEVMAARA